MKTLKDAKVGETVRVKKLYGEGPVKRRRAGSGDCRIRRRPMREARWPARFREARRYPILSIRMME